MRDDFDDLKEENDDALDFGVKKSAVLDPEEEDGAGEIVHADNADFELAENPNDEYEGENESSFALYEADGNEDDLSLQF